VLRRRQPAFDQPGARILGIVLEPRRVKAWALLLHGASPRARDGPRLQCYAAGSPRSTSHARASSASCSNRAE